MQEGWDIVNISAELNVILKPVLTYVGLQFLEGRLLPRGNVSCKAAGQRREFGQEPFNGLYQKILPLFLRKKARDIADDKGALLPVSLLAGRRRLF